MREHTWVFSSFVSVDEARYENDEGEQRYGAHEPDEPALVRDAAVNTGQTCGTQNILLTLAENTWRYERQLSRMEMCGY